MNWNPSYALLLLGITVISYTVGLSTERNRRKQTLSVGIVLCLLPLIVFKYMNFINESVFSILHTCGLRIQIPEFKLLLPVGISFFTFKAISYMIDIYKGKLVAEKHPGIYALYISFFVDLAAGPIDRANTLIPQLRDNKKFCPDNIVKGLKLMLWGYFMKVVIADRITLYVDPIFNNLDNHSGISVLLAAALFSLQIYCDFGGYSFIAIGCGKAMGFDLMTNFERPYMANSVSDFWRRWHISLSTWFRDYVYIPLGGNRCSAWRNRLNLLITFTVSGLWHGANWTFVVWGFLNGLLQIIDKKLKVKNVLLTFILMTIAWTFFRANSIDDAIQALSMLCIPKGQLYIPQMSLLVYIIMGVVTLVFCDFLWEKKGIHPLLENKYIVIRFTSYIILTIMILAFGVFDGGQFIYFQF